jgi:hypothetical protein
MSEFYRIASVSTRISYTICFKWPHKKSQGFKSGERAADKTGQLRPIEEAIDKMQFDVVDLLILSVGRVEDDKDIIPVRAAFSKL